MSCKCFNRRFVFKNTDSFDHKYVNSKCKCTSRFTICENKSKFTIASKIKELIPSMALIDFDDVSSYFFHSDGTVKDIRDTDIKSLGAEYIDTASDKLGYIFDELCNIERNEL